MKKHLKSMAFAGVLGATFLASACTSRYIVDVTDDPKGRATAMKTYDTKNALLFKTEKDVFWDCTQSAEKLTCEKVCDRKDERGEKILCPTIRKPGWQ